MPELPVTVLIGEAAKYLGVSIGTLRRWEKGRKICSVRSSGGTRRYETAELNRVRGLLLGGKPLLPVVFAGGDGTRRRMRKLVLVLLLLFFFLTAMGFVSFADGWYGLLRGLGSGAVRIAQSPWGIQIVPVQPGPEMYQGRIATSEAGVGHTGVTGVSGLRGAGGGTGSTGFTGSKGEKGDTGAAGAQGYTGFSGYSDVRIMEVDIPENNRGLSWA